MQTFIKRYKPGTQDSQSAAEKEMKMIVPASPSVGSIGSDNKSQFQFANADTISRLLSVSHDETTTTAPPASSAHGIETNTNTIDTATKEQLYNLIAMKNDNLSSHMGTQNTDEVNSLKLALMFQIQKKLYQRTYRFPHYFKYLSIICIVIFSVLCVVITTIWCLWFEVSLRTNNNYEESVMIDNGYIPLETVLNYNVTQCAIDNIVRDWENNGRSLYSPPEYDSFNVENNSVTSRFLLAVLLSYCLSVFLWQPLFLALKSFCKLRLLHKRPNRVNEALLFYNEMNVVPPGVTTTTASTNEHAHGNSTQQDLELATAIATKQVTNTRGLPPLPPSRNTSQVSFEVTAGKSDTQNVNYKLNFENTKRGGEMIDEGDENVEELYVGNGEGDSGKTGKVVQQQGLPRLQGDEEEDDDMGDMEELYTNVMKSGNSGKNTGGAATGNINSFVD